MNEHEAMLDDVAMYALGALPPDDAQRVRAHLAQCDSCRQEYERLKDVAAVLALGAQDPAKAAAPSSALKRRIIAAAKPPQRRAAAWPAFALAAACLALAAIFGGLYASLLHHSGQADRQLAQQNAVLADLLAPSAHPYRVAGGEVVRNGDRIYIAMRKLPPPPKGKVYQAWTLRIGATKMTPSSTFVPRNGIALLRLPVNGSDVAAVAVSAEPAGGSKQPTSKPVFVTKLT